MRVGGPGKRIWRIFRCPASPSRKVTCYGVVFRHPITLAQQKSRFQRSAASMTSASYQFGPPSPAPSFSRGRSSIPESEAMSTKRPLGGGLMFVIGWMTILIRFRLSSARNPRERWRQEGLLPCCWLPFCASREERTSVARHTASTK